MTNVVLGFQEPQKPLIKTEAFWERFTNAEMLDIEVGAFQNLSGTDPQKKAAAKVRVFRDDANSSGYRNLDKNKVRNFVTDLETTAGTSGNILAAGRAAVILDTPITDDERFYIR